MKHAAHIRWYDSISGEGMVRLADGRSVFLHFSAIQGVNKNNHQWPTPDDRLRLRNIDGMLCTVTIFEDTTCTIIESCELEGLV